MAPRRARHVGLGRASGALPKIATRLAVLPRAPRQPRSILVEDTEDTPNDPLPERLPGTGVIESISTPGLPGGASSTAVVPFPFGCFAPNCAFVIEADEADVEMESDEVNNVEPDFCLG